jgi:hypothetical protein
LSQESLSSPSDLLLVNMPQSVAARPPPLHRHKAALAPPLSNFPGSNPASGLNFELQFPSNVDMEFVIVVSRFSNINSHTLFRLS